MTDWPSWTPTVSAVEALDGAELTPGARFKLRQPRLQPAIWTVRSIVSGEAFTWSMTRLGISATARHTIASTANGATRLTLGMAFSGLLAPLLWLLAGSLIRQYVCQEALALKAVVERNPDGPGGAS